MADDGLGLQRMAELECEDGFSFCSIGTDAVDDVIEGIVETVVEGEVRRKVLLIVENLCLKLVYLLKTKEGDLYLILFLYLIAHIWLVFFLRASYVAQDL